MRLYKSNSSKRGERALVKAESEALKSQVELKHMRQRYMQAYYGIPADNFNDYPESWLEELQKVNGTMLAERLMKFAADPLKQQLFCLHFSQNFGGEIQLSEEVTKRISNSYEAPQERSYKAIRTLERKLEGLYQAEKDKTLAATNLSTSGADFKALLNAYKMTSIVSTYFYLFDKPQDLLLLWPRLRERKAFISRLNKLHRALVSFEVAVQHKELERA